MKIMTNRASAKTCIVTFLEMNYTLPELNYALHEYLSNREIKLAVKQYLRQYGE
jgi:hypothetical protein